MIWNYPLIFVRITSRLTLGILVCFCCAIVALILKFLGLNHSVIYTIFNFCKKSLIFLFKIKVEFYGKIPNKPGIIMPNHRSYVDTLLIPTKIPIVFVAKSSVKHWPIFGWGGNALDTVWVNRESKRSRKKTREELKKRLEKHKSVIVFPEGMTTRGPEILELKPGMFHTVAEGGFPIIAVAIEYKDSTIAFIDNDLFIPHFIKAFSKPKIEVKVRFSEPFIGTDGDVLRKNVAIWLRDNTLNFRKEWDKIIEFEKQRKFISDHALVP